MVGCLYSEKGAPYADVASSTLLCYVRIAPNEFRGPDRESGLFLFQPTIYMQREPTSTEIYRIFVEDLYHPMT